MSQRAIHWRDEAPTGIAMLVQQFAATYGVVSVYFHHDRVLVSSDPRNDIAADLVGTYTRAASRDQIIADVFATITACQQGAA